MPNYTTDNESHVIMTYTIDRTGNSDGVSPFTTYVFSPTPLIEVSRNVQFAGKEQIGTDVVINFTGHLVAPRFIDQRGKGRTRAECGEQCVNQSNGDPYAFADCVNDCMNDAVSQVGTQTECPEFDIDQDVLDNDIEMPTLSTGYTNITVLNALMRKMSQVLSVPGGKFELYEKCGECKKTFFKCYPSAISEIKFSNSPDNWTTTIPYSFSMTISRTDVFAKDTDGNDVPLYLETVSEEWSIQPSENSNSLEDIAVHDSLTQEEQELNDKLVTLHHKLAKAIEALNCYTPEFPALPPTTGGGNGITNDDSQHAQCLSQCMSYCQQLHPNDQLAYDMCILECTETCRGDNGITEGENSTDVDPNLEALRIAVIEKQQDIKQTTQEIDKIQCKRLKYNNGTRIFTVTHTLSATGKTVYGLQTGADKDFLAYDPSSHGISTFNDNNVPTTTPDAITDQQREGIVRISGIHDSVNLDTNGVLHIPESEKDSIHEWKRKEQKELAKETYDKYIAINQNYSKEQTLTAYDFAKKWVESKLYDTRNVASVFDKPLQKDTQSINNRYGFDRSPYDGSDTSNNDHLGRGVPLEDSYDSATDTDGRDKPLEDIFVLDYDLCFLYPTQSKGKAFNHTRQKSGNRINGTYSVTETWVLIVGQYADYAATDDYSVEYSEDNKTGISTVSINGTVQGYAEGNIYWDDQAKRNTKIRNAENLFQTLDSGAIFQLRAQEFIAAVRMNGGVTINALPTSRTVKKQTKEGTIQYTYNFDSRCPLMIPNASYESFQANMVQPNDIFGTVIIPGRQRGPLFFSANTHTAPKYTITYEVVLKPLLCSKSPPPNDEDHKQQLKEYIENRIKTTYEAYIDQTEFAVKVVLLAHYKYLKDNCGWDIIKVENHSEGWSFNEMRLTGNVTFVGGSCTSVGYKTPITQYLRSEYEADRDSTTGQVETAIPNILP